LINPDRYPLTQDQIDSYQANRCLRLKNVLSTAEIQRYGQEISRLLVDLNTMHLPMAERDTYSRAFLQVMNLWTRSDATKELVFSQRLAQIAAELMDVDGVRLYHDQGLYKEPGGGHTPWHADQYYWPLSTDRTVTAWIPLQSTPLEMGPLEFASRSHQLEGGRSLGISDESEVAIDQMLANGGFEHVVAPFDLGDVSFHSGWLYHRAGPNVTDMPRGVMTIIYMDADMVLQNPENDNQRLDWETWCPGARVGEIIDTPLNPLLFRK
jgi:ectoine hydroxylase-related dioxygenase (phytanoyl-CoA dioxygenase family)